MISCLCPTYGRPPDFLHLLEEAVESYLRQDRPAKCELVVLNDCPGQKLTCQADDVRVMNVDRRFDSLGDKFNALVELAKGNLLLPWEDDDLSLPGRISQAVAMLGGDDYYKPTQVVFWPAESGLIFKHAVGVRHHASVFRRSAWEKVGGYPAISGAQDAGFDAKLRAQCRVAPEGNLLPSQYQYIYRWGVSNCHLSGVASHDEYYRQLGQRPTIDGTFEIKPHWRRDYQAEIAAALAATLRG